MIIWLLLEENNLVQTLFLYPSSLKWLIFWHNYSQFVYYFRKINKKVFPTTKIAPPLHFMWSICYKLTNVYSSGLYSKSRVFQLLYQSSFMHSYKARRCNQLKIFTHKKEVITLTEDFLGFGSGLCLGWKSAAKSLTDGNRGIDVWKYSLFSSSYSLIQSV